MTIRLLTIPFKEWYHNLSFPFLVQCFKLKEKPGNIGTISSRQSVQCFKLKEKPGNIGTISSRQSGVLVCAMSSGN